MADKRAIDEQINDQLGTAVSEVQADAQGLPQMAVIEDGTYTNQVIWLFVVFILLYVLVSRRVFPAVSTVLEDRDGRIQADLDKAEADKVRSESIREQYDTAVVTARSEAQKVIVSAKQKIQQDLSAASAKLDTELGARVGIAEAEVNAARAAALADIKKLAGDVASEMTEKLSGLRVAKADIDTAIEKSIPAVREA